MQQQVFSDHFLRSHVRDTHQGQYLVRFPSSQQRVREPQCVRRDDIVVGESVNQ